LDDEIELGGRETRWNDVSLGIFDLDWTLLTASDASAAGDTTSSAKPAAEPWATVTGLRLRAPSGANSRTACT
jgi:hypothetical protein